ncbi:3'-5' exonuclease [Bradyrhizobium sp. SEMIA]|uniref:3'-5' exonuclease n=1 Tax=Bradyrhizobium sp. SEMIA TaxID=2597515 RepID=UPI0018A5F8A7|nr:3'-5' exonuclease [Bradyrhizobium sp. SEMIA]QOG19238.1 hypothetical protein FOM02_19700 [Bradyrhizobium sp. SEMIA]
MLEPIIAGAKRLARYNSPIVLTWKLRLRISGSISRNVPNAPQDGVALATYFKAKGLQWHTVILTSCNEGLIPHKRAPVEDERRLFYVALTRASSNLVVSYLKTSCKTRVAASTFLTQAGLHG